MPSLKCKNHGLNAISWKWHQYRCTADAAALYVARVSHHHVTLQTRCSEKGNHPGKDHEQQKSHATSPRPKSRRGIAAVTTARVDTGSVFSVISGPLHIITVVTPVTRRTKPECPNATPIHACGLDAVIGLIQVVAACWLWRVAMVP